MSKRKEEKPTIVNGKPAVGAQEAARLLSERAAAMGFTRNYSRNAIFRLYQRGKLVAAVEAEAGNLYYLEDVEQLPIKPQVGRQSKKSSQAGGDKESSSVL